MAGPSSSIQVPWASSVQSLSLCLDRINRIFRIFREQNTLNRPYDHSAVRASAPLIPYAANDL